jgi:hypothetical protein
MKTSAITKYGLIGDPALEGKKSGKLTISKRQKCKKNSK